MHFPWGREVPCSHGPMGPRGPNVGGESLLSANATFQPMKLMTLLVDNWTIGNFRQLTLIFYGIR